MLPSKIFTTPVDQNYINTSHDEENINNNDCSYSFDAYKDEYYNLILNSFRKSRMSNSKENSFVLNKTLNSCNMNGENNEMSSHQNIEIMNNFNYLEKTQSNSIIKTTLPISNNGKVKITNILNSDWKDKTNIIKSNIIMMFNFTVWSLNNNSNSSNAKLEEETKDDEVENEDNDLLKYQPSKCINAEDIKQQINENNLYFNPILFNQFLTELNQGKIGNINNIENNNNNKITNKIENIIESNSNNSNQKSSIFTNSTQNNNYPQGKNLFEKEKGNGNNSFKKKKNSTNLNYFNSNNNCNNSNEDDLGEQTNSIYSSNNIINKNKFNKNSNQYFVSGNNGNKFNQQNKEPRKISFNNFPIKKEKEYSNQINHGQSLVKEIVNSSVSNNGNNELTQNQIHQFTGQSLNNLGNTGNTGKNFRKFSHNQQSTNNTVKNFTNNNTINNNSNTSGHQWQRRATAGTSTQGGNLLTNNNIYNQNSNLTNSTNFENTGEYSNLQFKKPNIINTNNNKISNFKHFNKFNIDSNTNPIVSNKNINNNKANNQVENSNDIRKMSFEPKNYLNNLNNNNSQINNNCNNINNNNQINQISSNLGTGKQGIKLSEHNKQKEKHKEKCYQGNGNKNDTVEEII